MKGNVKVIHRYFSYEIGELLMYYIWIVLPYQQKLEITILEKDQVWAFMWPSDPDGKKRISQRQQTVLQRES